MEWQVRQLTVAVLACMPPRREMRLVLVSWQSRQVSFAPDSPTGLLILVLSPPASACSVPSPWQATHVSFDTTPFVTLAPRA